MLIVVRGLPKTRSTSTYSLSIRGPRPVASEASRVRGSSGGGDLSDSQQAEKMAVMVPTSVGLVSSLATALSPYSTTWNESLFLLFTYQPGIVMLLCAGRTT